MKLDLLAQAVAIAARSHEGQTKPGAASEAAPYLYHPLAVASLVLKHGGDVEQAAAALLHDVDGASPTMELGPEVARLVASFSDPAGVANDWRSKKLAYLAKLREQDERVLLVAACEELHEISELMTELRLKGAHTWQRFPVAGFDVAWYFRELLAIFHARLTGERYRPLVTEFAFLVRVMKDVVFEGGSPRGQG